MTTATISDRTVVRAAFLDALELMNGHPDVREPEFQLATDFLSADQIQQAIAYCVLVGDEDPEEPQKRVVGAVPYSLAVKIVIYARDEKDRHARLDGAIQDVWEWLRNGQRVHHVVPYLEYAGVQVMGEGTDGKSLAQAIMRWTAKGLRRSVSW